MRTHQAIAILALLIAAAMGHVSSCPDANPLAFWKLGGPGAYRPRSIEIREFSIPGVLPTCRDLGRGFNGLTHLVAFAGTNYTNASLPGFLDALPASIGVVMPENSSDPLCFNWSVPSGYNVYLVAVSTIPETIVEWYSPTPMTSGGPICAPLPGNASTVIITLCYAPTVDVAIGEVLHESWYSTPWSLTVAPDAVLGVVCASATDPYRRSIDITATPSAPVPTRRVVSGSFDVFGNSGAAAAWILVTAGDNATEILPADVACAGSDPIHCAYSCSVDPTSMPFSVVATARAPSSGTLDGVACAAVPAETIQEVCGSDCILSWDDLVLVDTRLPYVGAVDLLESPTPGTYVHAATLASTSCGLPNITAPVTLTLISTDCQ
jgi:hypothetical protein